MDREVMRMKDELSVELSRLVYNGYWFSPEAEFVMNCLKQSQKMVSGKVVVELFKGNVRNVGRQSENSLYSESLVSMDEHGEHDPTIATGFIKTLATRLIARKQNNLSK